MSFLFYDMMEIAVAHKRLDAWDRDMGELHVYDWIVCWIGVVRCAMKGG